MRVREEEEEEEEQVGVVGHKSRRINSYVGSLWSITPTLTLTSRLATQRHLHVFAYNKPSPQGPSPPTRACDSAQAILSSRPLSP